MEIGLLFIEKLQRASQTNEQTNKHAQSQCRYLPAEVKNICRPVTRGGRSGRATPVRRQKGQKVRLVSQVKESIFKHAIKLKSFVSLNLYVFTAQIN